MRDELVERMARAIYEHRNGYGCTPWNIRSRSHRDPYLADAAASLRAIEEAGAVVVPVDEAMREHLSIASMCLPIREYQGGMWFGRNDEFPDATFRDFGACRSFSAIVSAMLASSPYAEKNNDTR